MARRYFNWKLAVVVMIAAMMLVVTAIGLRKWQKGHKSSIAYESGLKAYEDQKWDQAAKDIGRYVASNPNDIDMLYKYASAQLKRRPVTPGNIYAARDSYRQILRFDESQVKAARKLSELYLQMNVPGEAEAVLSKFPDIASSPKLSVLLAITNIAQKKFSKASSQLEKIIETNPEYIPAYDAMIQLASTNPKVVTKTVDYWVEKAVGNNSTAVKPYLIRANYKFRKGDKAGFENDLAKIQQMEIDQVDDKMNLARLYFNAGKFEVSEKYLKEILDETPGKVNAWKLMVEVAARTGSKQKVLQAVSDARQAMERDPWDFLGTAAEVYLRYEMVEEASKCISMLKEKKIHPLNVGRYEAMIADINADPFASIKAWRDVIGMAKNTQGAVVSPAVRMSLAKAHFRANDSVAAVKELNGILRDHSDYWPANLALAVNASDNANYLQAAEYARKVLKSVPSHPQANTIAIESNMNLLTTADQKPSDESLALLNKQIDALANNPSLSIQANLLKFRMAIGQADSEVAEKIARKLKSDHPNDIRAALAMADYYASQKKREETVAVLKQVINDFPAAPEPVRYLASVLSGANKRQQAVEVIKQAIDKSGSSESKINLYLTLADLYQNWNHQDESYELLQFLTTEYSGNIQIMTRLLATNKLSGDTQKAQTVVDRIKNITGEDSWKWRYHQCRVWFLSEKFKDHYTKIVSLMKTNLLENPAAQASRLLLAGSYFKAGDTLLALSIYKEAFDRSPQNENVILPYVSALYQAGQYDTADQVMDKVSGKTMQSSQLSRFKVDQHIRQGDYTAASDLLRSSFTSSTTGTADKLTLAMLEMQQKNYAQAAEMLENLKTTVTEPGFLRSIVAAQIQLSLRQKDHSEAIKISNELVNDDKTAASLLIRARTYYAIKDKEKAIADYNHALEKEPENPDIWAARSSFYVTEGEMQKAVDDILKALEFSKNDTLLQARAVSMMIADRNNFKQGIKLLDDSLAASPSDPGLLMIKARTLFTKGTAPAFKQAGAILTRIASDNPANIEAWNMLGRIALLNSQYAKAVNFAQKGLLAKPGDRTLMLLKAQAESGRSPAFAIPTLKALHDLDPDNVESSIFLANTYSETGHTGKAVDLLEAQLNKTDDKYGAIQLRIALARAKYINGQTDQAKAQFTDLLKNKPSSLAALDTYSILLIGDGKYDQSFEHISKWIDDHAVDSLAVLGTIQKLVRLNLSNRPVLIHARTAFERVSELNPDSDNALQSLANMYQMLGQVDEVLPLYEKIHRLNPRNLIVLNNLAWVYSQHSGKHQKALEMASRGIEINPDYADLVDTRGYIYAKLGQYDKAIVDFNKCLQLYPPLNPSIITVRLHLAQAYEKNGQKEQAIKQLNTLTSMRENFSSDVILRKKKEFKQAAVMLKKLTSRGK